MKKIDEKISIGWFIGSIIVGIGLIYLSYIFSTQSEMETSLTAYVAVLGAVPTAYLWIVKEKKKEKELYNKERELQSKDEELFQKRVAELNKVYVDAVNQFYDEKQFLAGLFALYGILGDWLNILEENPSRKNDISIKVEQISSIIFSANTKMFKQKNSEVGKAYYSLAGDVTAVLAIKSRDDKINEFSWDKYNIRNVIIKSGWDLHDVEFIKADLSDAKMIGCNLEGAIFQNSMMGATDFTGSNLSNAKIRNCIVAGTIFSKSHLDNSTIANQTLTYAKFELATLEETTLSNVNFYDCSFKDTEFIKTKISGVDFSSSDISDAQFCELNFKNREMIELSTQKNYMSLQSLMKNKYITINILENFVLLDTENKLKFNNPKRDKEKIFNEIIKGLRENDNDNNEIKERILPHELVEQYIHQLMEI